MSTRTITTLLSTVLPLAVMCVLAGSAVAQSERSITDVSALAGTWHGSWNNPRGGQAPAQIVIKGDGSWTFYVTGGGTTTGKITPRDGKMHYQGSVGEPGTVALMDNRGKEVLRFIRRDGTIASEFER